MAARGFRVMRGFAYSPEAVQRWDACAAVDTLVIDGPPPPQSCLGDLNGDNVVNGADLGQLLGNWAGSGLGDLNNDGIVNGADLGLMLGEWGACP